MSASPNIIADIGGTNARFALADESGALSSIEVLQCTEFKGPIEAVQAYLAKIDCSTPLAQASFSVAAALAGDRVNITNNHWAFGIIEVEQALGLEKLTVINDFAAKALAIPKLGEADLLRIGGGEVTTYQPVAILGPGTGLGVASLIHTESGWTPVAGEGGHVSWAPQNDREVDIHRELQREFGHVSAERLVSGPGLESIHAALEQIDSKPPSRLTAPEITQAALDNSSSLCTETLNLFCGVLGNVAGNLALSIGAQGGVYIGGGIVRNFLDYIPASPFRAQFENKGRFAEYLRSIPTYIITVPNTGLIGAAAALKRD